MRKTTLLLYALLFSFVGYSQFPTPGTEGFENTTGLDLALPASTSPWTLGTGVTSNQWAVFDNGVVGNPQKRWDRATTNFYAGSQAAFINRKQNNGIGIISEDYLATPLVTVPANGQLLFYTRTGFNSPDDVNYLIKVNTITTAGSQTTPANYSNTVQTWNNTNPLVTTYNVYELKTVNLSAYAGQQVYIAFVRVFNQPTGALGGNSWYVDEVKLVQQCVAPTNLTAPPANISTTSANLSWTPNGATSWEIEIVNTTAGGLPTGTGTLYNGTLPYVATGLTPATGYAYYVRSTCTDSNSSWAGPFNFTTLTPGLTCPTAIIVPPVLPYNTSDTTANYADTYDVTQPTACAGTATNYMAGNDVFYSYTAATTGAISITMTPGGTNSGIFVYQGCGNVGVTCLAGVANTGSGVRNISSVNVTAGQTYIIVLSSNATTQTYSYNLLIQQLNCAPPTSLAAGTITATGANLSWSSPTATSWQYTVQPAGSPVPTVAGTTTNSSTNTPVTGLNSDTAYQYWVRADCGNGTFSPWSGPFLFTTLVAPPVCGGFFVDAGGQAGNYPSNVTAATGTTTINPVNLGDQVTVTFTSFNTQAGNDLLKVYDGTSSAGILLATYSGTPAVPFSITSSSPNGSLTFVFTSNATTQAAGWVANVTCAPAPVCQKPIVLTTSAILYNSVTVGWTQTANPDTTVPNAWEVIALPCGSPAPSASATGAVSAGTNPFAVTGLSPLTCYDFYVRAVCSSTSSSSWTGPISATTPIAPPMCGGQFTNQPGTTAGSYPASSDSTVTICPNIPGEQVTVTFVNFSTESNWDGLYVFDGNSNTAPLLASSNGAGNVPGGVAGSYWGTLTGANLPGPFTSSSTDGCLTFRFRSDTSVSTGGWLANITCAPAPSCSKPKTLSVTASSTTATLNWTQPQNPDTTTATSWEVIIQPSGTGAPTSTATGTIVTSLPYIATGLIPGTNYEFYVRAVCSSTSTSPWSGPKTFFTAVSCADSQPFCGATGQTYVNTTGAPSYGQIGCLFTTPNPAWFYMQVQASGNLSFTIHQGSNAPLYDNQDVDFIAWGPFTPSQYSTMCNNLYDFPSGNTAISDNTAGCSYSFAATENFTIPNAVVGNYYLVLITNFSNQPGTVVFNQTNLGGSGAGSTDCNIVCSVVLGPDVQLCNQTSYTITSSNQGATSYKWYNGTTLIPGQTGSSLVVTQSGTYTCTITCGLNTSSDSINVTFNTPVTPTFTQIQPLCHGVTPPALPTTSTNTIGITGVWSPASIDTSVTGTVHYTFTPTLGQCAGPASMDVIVTNSITPTFITPAPICSGAPAPLLPTSSSNVPPITGYWTPALVSNTASGTYTFTPNSGQCASSTTLNVTVNTNCAFGSFANAIWLQNCSTSNFFNTVGSGADIIGPVGNVFQNSNLGTYVQNSNTFILRGAEVKTFKSTTANVCSARLNYRIYPATTTPGTFQIMDLPFFDNCSGGSFPSGGPCNTGDQKWHRVVADGTTTPYSPVNLTAYAPGNYVLQVYYDISGSSFNVSGCDENILIDNNGAYFTSTFTILAQPTYASTNPTTCSGANGTITISGLAPSTTYGVSYQHGSTPVGPLNLISNASGEIIITGLNAATYSNFSIVLNSCVYPNTTSIVLVDPSIPTVSVNSPTVCTSLPATLTATPGIAGTYSYAWSYPVGVSNPGNVDHFDTTVAGTYSVIITNSVTSCSSASASGTVAFNSSIIPTFAPIAPICLGDTAPLLPTSSNNSTPIVGVWNPTVINTTIAGTTPYTFTPNAGQCSQPISINVSVNSVPTPTIGILTQPNCTTPTGTVEVTSPISSLGILPTDLFISEATDSNSGSLSYVELYNGTGASINLSNYTIKTANNGGAYGFSLPLNNISLSTGSTYVVALGNNSSNACSTPGGNGSLGAQSNASGSVNFSVNGHDHYALFNGSNQIDSWGTFGSNNWAPSFIGNEGADFRRKTTASPLPNTNYNNNDWDILDYAGNTPADCSNNDYTNIGLYTLNTTSSNYQYSVDGGTYQTSPIFSGLTPGTHNITVQDTVTGCVSVIVPVTLNTPVLNPSVTTFSYTSPVCINVSPTLTPNTSAAGFTTGGFYSLTSGTGLNVNAATGVVNLATALPGTYEITYAVLANSALCLDAGSTTTTLVINALPTITGNLYACVGNTTQLTGSATPATTNAWASSNTSVATISGTGLVSAVASGVTTITYTNSDGCQKTAIVTINALPTITGSLSVCAGNTTQLLGSASPATVNAWSSSNTSVATISNTGLVTAIASGTTTITYTNSNGCQTTRIVTVNSIPVVTVSSDTICQGATATINATPSISGNYTYAWSGPVGSNPGTSATVTTTIAGNYSVVITNTVTGCVSASAFGTVTFIPAFDFTLNGECLDNKFTLEVIPTNSSFDVNSANYSWTLNPSLATIGSNSTFDATTYISGLTSPSPLPVTFSAAVNVNGCVQSHSIMVDRIYCDIQKGISPNNDALNDFFDLRLMNVQQLEIFNRYGTKVYSKMDYTNEWIGQSDTGNELPDGTYYYVIDFKNNQPSKTGWIYINRDSK